MRFVPLHIKHAHMTLRLRLLLVHRRPKSGCTYAPKEWMDHLNRRVRLLSSNLTFSLPTPFLIFTDQLFVIERTPSLREEQPNKQMRELMSVLADEWKSLSEAQKTVRVD